MRRFYYQDGNDEHEENAVIEQMVLEPSTENEPLLSAELRAQTAALHQAAEYRLGLPNSVNSREDYTALLARFYGLYQPLETRLAAATSGHDLAPLLQSRHQTERLADDLRSLGTDPGSLPLAPASALPALPDVSAALGAHYVLEGSTLGGAIILRDLEKRLGSQITAATRFFGGRGKSLGPMWQSFRTELDAYGKAWPRRRETVVIAAQQTFDAMLSWCASP